MQRDYLENVPCKVCGCKDLNLIEGYYYCIECGTQDTTARETTVEQLDATDHGRFIKPWTLKLKTATPEQKKVCPEWHKWHCYNYILAGMADEVVSCGASPSFKTKVLWLWSMYMKKYQDKRQLGLPTEEDDENDLSEELLKKKRTRNADDIREMSIALLFTILYVACIYDKSDIQLSHLIRFTQERRLSFVGYMKFVPKDIDLYIIDNFRSFIAPAYNLSADHIQFYSWMFITTFDLGSPVVPDLKKIADRFITELCLPDEFKNLVHSLMHLVPCNHLIFYRCNKTRPLPFYECEVMAYIIVGLKMCFGLDDNYEIKLSDVVDQINNENCHMKCYKLGGFSTFSDRLFSFRQWCTFLKLRRLILCKLYWPMGQLSNMDVDDYVYMEQRELPLLTLPPTLRGEIIMNILNKINELANVDAIPNSAFPPTLTPLTTYTNIVLEYFKDPELKLLLSEDFTKYSLKYACEKLDLRVTGDTENIVVGVESTAKRVEPMGESKMSLNKYDTSMIYVRNCDNKNWTITNPPTLNHIINASEHNSDKENEIYDSPENKCDVGSSKSIEDFVTDEGNIAKTTELLQDKCVNIFDDDFQNLEEHNEIYEDVKIKTEQKDEFSPEINVDIDNDNIDNNVDDTIGNDNFNNNVDDNVYDNNIYDNIVRFFDRQNREETIKELVLLTCKKYHIPVPREYKTKEPNKIVRSRKTTTSEPKTKRPRLSSSFIQTNVSKVLSAYRDKTGYDLLAKLLVNNSVIDRYLHDNRNDVNSMEHNACYQDDGNCGNNTTFDHHTDNESVVDSDPSVLLTTHDVDPHNVNTQADLFDENIYNIKQLYLRVREPSTDRRLPDVLDVSKDPEIDKLLTKKIDECIDAESEEHMPVKKKYVNYNRLSDQINSKQYKQLDYLIKNRRDIQKFKYWIRHPTAISKFKCFIDASGDKRFKSELDEYFPTSFAFVFNECASIVDCRLLTLYKSVIELEKAMLSILN